MKHIVEYLLNNGANMEAVTMNGATPLMRAIESSKVEVVQYLIDSGAKLQIENRKGTEWIYGAVFGFFFTFWYFPFSFLSYMCIVWLV